MKSMKIFVALVLCAALLAGCKGEADKKVDSNIPKETSNIGNNQVDKGTGTLDLKLVKKTEKAQYLLTNGIKILYAEKNVDDKNERKINIVQISGLVDKALEKKINEDIERETLDIAKLQMSKPSWDGTNFRNLYCSAAINANNLLSVDISVDENPIESISIHGLLYRLTDGKRLELKDIFTEETDYVGLINRKVTETILSKGIEEKCLREPFITISPSQNFVLSRDLLKIVFREGEGGFSRDYSLGIPLSDIDDYIDAIDRYMGTEKVKYEDTSLMQKGNNNFVIYNNEITPLDNGDIWGTYVEVAGLKDEGFEKLINTKIKKAMDEVAQNKDIKALKKPEFKDMPVVRLVISPLLNSHGILILKRYVYSEGENKAFHELQGFYSFNLMSKKEIDCKAILTDYLSKNKGENAFELAVRDKLKNNIYSNIPAEVRQEIDLKVNYALIKDEGEIGFSEYDRELFIDVHFENNLFPKYPGLNDAQIPFGSVIKTSPEEFFGTR